MRALRIALANWSASVVGGTETYLSALVPALASRGHAVGLLHEVEPAAGHAPIVAPGSDVAEWSIARSGRAGALAALAAWRPDIVFLHGLTDPDLEASVLAAYPCALFAHGYYGTCASGTKAHRFPRPFPCARTFGAACLALYLPRRCGGLDPVVALAHYRLQCRRRAFLARYRAVVVASRHMRREMVRHGVADDRLSVVPLIVDAPPDGAEPSPHAPGGHLLLVGRAYEAKGGELLLRAVPLAASRLGSALRVTIAGEGPALARWLALARRLGVEATFPGWVGPAARATLARQADLLVVPSVWPEPFGMVGLEAFAVGLPAAGFAVGGIPEWLLPGETGELAPGDPPTVEGLAAAIVRALGDAAHYGALRRGAWAFAVRHAAADPVAALETVLERATA